MNCADSSIRPCTMSGAARDRFYFTGNTTEGVTGMTVDAPVLTIDPSRQFGRVCIEGSRIPAEVIAENVAAGDSVDEVAEGYAITRDQVLLACWWQVEVERMRRSRSKSAKALLAAWGPWADNVENFKALARWRDAEGECPDPPEIRQSDPKKSGLGT